MSLIDIKKVKEEARKQVAEEGAEKAKNALIAAYRRLDAAKAVVANVEREIADLEQSIEEGSFKG